MKSVCQALGVARSNVHALRSRPTTWVDGRTGRTPRGDSELLAEIREQIAELPSYGYRRACALVNQQRPAGTPRVNPKRAYRVMAGNGLLLPKAPTRPRSSRPHNGTVAVQAQNLGDREFSFFDRTIQDDVIPARRVLLKATFTY